MRVRGFSRTRGVHPLTLLGTMNLAGCTADAFLGLRFRWHGFRLCFLSVLAPLRSMVATMSLKLSSPQCA